MKLKTLLTLSTIALCLPFYAQAESLEQAVNTTLQQHPQVEGALAALQSAKQAEKEQYSGYYPTLSATMTGGRIFGDNSTSRGLSVTRGEGYSYLWEGNFAARQKIFDGMETKNRVEAAKREKDASKLNVADIRETLAFSTIQTYINLVRVRRGLALLHGQEKSVKDYLSRIETMVEDGAADEAELQQARDVLVILDNFIADYKGQARALESDYAQLTGHLPDTALEQPTVIGEDQIPLSVDDAITIAKEAHPLLQAAQLQSQSAHHLAKAEESILKPDVDGELSFLKTDKEDVIGGEVTDARAVVRMNWEFETGGGQKARIKQRTYEHKQSLARIGEVEREIERSVRQAYAELETATRQLENQKRRQDLNKKLLETYKVQFEGALISVLQLMQADNQVLLTKLETSNAQNRVLLAKYGILAAMGNLQDAMGIQLAASYPSRGE